MLFDIYIYYNKDEIIKVLLEVGPVLVVFT